MSASAQPPTAPRPRDRLCRRVAIALALVMFVGLPLAWLVRALQFQSIGSFSASLTFPTVATYRLFEDADLPIPLALTVGRHRGGIVNCLRDGQPNADLRQDQLCNAEIYSARLQRRTCDSLSSYWSNEVCVAAGMPESFLRNPRFLAILKDYARDPCDYVRDYDRLVAPAFARTRSWGTETAVARVIRQDFGCSDGGQATASNPPGNVEFWRKMRLFMLFEDAQGRVILQTELLLPL
jgi:hypothetical protein